MAVATNQLNSQVTISDTLIQGDTFNKYTLIVQDLDTPTRDFTGTTAKILLTQCGATVYQNNSPTLVVSTLGQVSYLLNLVPSVTTLFDTGTIRGEMEFTFPFTVDGENVVKTCFVFNFKVVSDLIA